MLGKGRAFIRNVLGSFEKRDGETSNCPRCDGSGLFHSQKSWFWNHRTYSNDPCWFCEGVGVMPLYGLRGFILGRASASFRTEDLRKPVSSHFQLHLCLAKYPDAKCKVGTVKSSDKIQELLYNRSESPSWLIDAAKELAVTGALENSGVDDEGLGVIMPDGGEGPRTVLHLPLDFSWLSSPRGQDRTTKSSKMVDKANLPRGVAQMLGMAWSALFQRKLRGLAGGRMKYGTVARPYHPGVVPSKLEPNAIDVKNFEVAKETQVEKVNREFRSRRTNSKRTRLARRNRIREQAEGEARERARWFLRLRPSTSEDSTSSTLSDQSDATWLSSIGWKELSSDWLAEETALVRQSIKYARAKAQAAPKSPSVNHILFARLVDKLPFIPNFIKSHNW